MCAEVTGIPASQAEEAAKRPTGPAVALSAAALEATATKTSRARDADQCKQSVANSELHDARVADERAAPMQQASLASGAVQQGGCTCTAAAAAQRAGKRQHDQLGAALPSQDTVVRLCDFGTAFVGQVPAADHDSPSVMTAYTACGSQQYAAPEVFRLIAMDSMRPTAEKAWPPHQYDWQQLRKEGYDPFAADVWSFGVMLFTLCTGLRPFLLPASADTLFCAFIRHTQPESAALPIYGAANPGTGLGSTHTTSAAVAANDHISS